jgi:cell wall-associated NlpC family hydrolase
MSFELFAQRMESSRSPLFAGISLARYSGPLGLRLGGALDFSRGHNGGGTRYVTQVRCRRGFCERVAVPASYGDEGSFFPAIGGWTADADLIFEPLRPIPVLRSLLLGFSPYAFAGIGGTSVRPADGIDTTQATWSLGGGVRHPLVGALGLSAEARYRHPLSSDSLPTMSNLRQHLEYRAGLTIAFGGGHRARASAPVAAAPAPAPAPEPADLSNARVVSRLLDAADGYVDTPYRRGGTSPQSGFDAPGFVQYLYAQQGVRLPRTTRELADAGVEVSTRIGALRPGDILLFANDGTNPDHVAVYAGRSRIIHATASGGVVRYDVLGEGERGEWFADHLVAARRVVGGERPANRDDAPDDDATGRPDRASRPTGGSR